MTYTWKAFLMVFLMFTSVDMSENITCEELMENIIYEGVFFGGLDDHTLNSPFLSNVTAYIYDDEIYAVSTDARDRTTIYCEIPKEDWDAFEEACNCSYSKKFDDYIRKHNCDCSSE